MHITRDEATRQINALHDGILSAARRSVQDAIKIGEIISEQKKALPHGEFLPWVKTLPFDERTARRYIQLNEYRDKTDTLSDLQTAYQQIETIEAQKRMTEEERRRALIAEYRKTGKKPEGWDRSCDYAVQKDEERDREYEAFKKEQAEKQKEREEADAERESRFKANRIISDALKVATDEIFKKAEQTARWKDKIRLSDSGKDDPFMDAILEYLEGLTDDNRRIEACQNIIKICRNIAVQLQKVS